MAAAKKLFTADLHFGHNDVVRFRPMFSSSEEHHEVISDRMASLVTKKDTMWILGDICFNVESIKYLQRIASGVGHLRLVPGNHDIEAARFVENLSGDVRIFAFKEERHCWYSHCPIHPGQFRDRLLNIHGHLHHEVVRFEDDTPDDRYFCVSLEQNDYHPFTWQEIKERT